MRHALSNRRAPTLCKHTVSGLFHRPHRAAFHLSLTVLFTIDHETYLAFPDSPGWFPQHFHVSRYSRTETESLFVFAYGAFTRFGQAFQPVRLTHRFVTFLSSQSQNPDPQLSGFRALRPKESTLSPQISDYWKLKIKMSSRRDDDRVPFGTLRRSNEEIA